MTEQFKILIKRLADQARRAQRSLNIFLLLSIAASGALAWMIYHPTASVARNAILCGLILLPVLVWGFIWSVLGQLRELPEVVAELTQEQGLAQSFKEVQAAPIGGLRGAVSTLKLLRQAGGLSTIVEAVGGVALLLNPIFALLAALAAFVLVAMILVAPILMIF